MFFGINRRFFVKSIVLLFFKQAITETKNYYSLDKKHL